MPTWNDNRRSWVSLHEATSYPIEVVMLPNLLANTWTRIPKAPTIQNPARIRVNAAGVDTRRTDYGFEIRSPVAMSDVIVEVDY